MSADLPALVATLAGTPLPWLVLTLLAYLGALALYRRSGERFSERAYSHGELCTMLETAGFGSISVYGELTFDEPKEDSQRNVYVAHKLS